MNTTPTLFVYGGQVNKEFVQYTAKLTKKDKPKICFLPTATGDAPWYIEYWYQLCHDLDVEPHVMKIWISSSSQDWDFEDFLLEMDAIIVGGGNTLNMMTLLKAHEIDKALMKAYKKGVILAGGSAGSLCWFNGGFTDSRPKQLTFVEGFNFLPYSHCPHYHSEPSRKPLFQSNIAKEVLTDGFACDDLAGIVFENEQPVKAISLNEKHHSYYVYKENDQIIEEQLKAEII
jgi:peptidase E